jgi:hypothetical protein
VSKSVAAVLVLVFLAASCLAPIAVVGVGMLVYSKKRRARSRDKS